MADQEERTEKPTQKRRNEAKKKGQIPKSQEVNSTAMLLAGFTLLILLSPIYIKKIYDITMWSFNMSYVQKISVDSFRILAEKYGLDIIIILGPLLISLVIIGISVSMIQVGKNWSLEPLKFKLKIDFKRALLGIFKPQALFNLGKGLMKIGLISIIAYIVLKAKVHEMTDYGLMPIHVSLNLYFKIVVEVVLKILFFLALLSIIDYIWQRYQHEKQIKMSKHEVKDERKQSEGDPAVKRKIRGKQYAMMQEIIVNNIKKAKVVITNPFHIAVALAYDIDTMPAPTVVAKGPRKSAERIKKIANENNIPIIENPPLAWSLYKVEVGEIIPIELYKAIAEILAILMTKERKAS